ncbi:MAG TPA: DUF1761 domain-containing protein [Gammaproteobacteria bacterium]|jgi:hypothetical protein
MHYLGILLAAVAMFALGAVWFSPVLFMKAWMREAGMDPEKRPDGRQMLRMLGLTFVLLLIAAIALDSFVANWSAGEGFWHGLWVGLMGGLLVAAATGINFLFEGRSFRHFLINAGYDVLGFCLMGMILSLL